MTIGASTRVAAVVGWPIAHSRSPALHNAAFRALGIDAVFVALEVAPLDLPAALRGMAVMRFLGASVTVPHKEQAEEQCDELDPSARDAGAVNCVVFDRHAQLIGHNTDAPGFVDALVEELGRSPAGARVVLLGAGGAARAVASGLRAAGAAEIDVVTRKPEERSWCKARRFTAAELDAVLPRADLLVDCTSAGLSQAAFPVPVPVERLPEGAAVATLVYGKPSALLDAARARGLATMDGAGMLVHQGARAFRLWTGRPAPLDAMWSAMRGA
ncbi:MAG TPA: shikimate dehydrogenase [Kofleriaceae bacterium]|nr:shikimate dehydrogenase [Kofleriaceae bacterium]